MRTTLEALFSSTARVEILHMFLLNPGHSYYQREIERETGQPIRAVQREVKRLTEVGLLSRSVDRNRVLFTVDPEFPMLAELRALFQIRKDAANEATMGLSGLERNSQPFPWMDTPARSPVSMALRRKQIAGEWDRAY